MCTDRPVRVFTDLKNPNKMISDFTVAQDTERKIQEARTLSSLDRQIKVTGVGELVSPPDRFSIRIKCQASKNNIQDAKNSVTRRADYITQTLQNHSLFKDNDYLIYQHTTHADSLVHINYEVEAHFTDVQKCQSVANLLSEKLGPGNSVTLPNCYHARGNLDKLRRQAGMLAIHNAKQKALEMAKILHLSVGHVLQVQELDVTENQGNAREDEELPDMNPSIQQRLTDATVYISSKVAVSFQLKQARAKKL